MNRSFFDLIFSFMERIVPRISSAAVLLGLAFLTNPSTVGVFTWALVGVTLYRAISENPVRNIATVSLASPEYLEFLNGILTRSKWIGTGAILTATALIAVLSSKTVGISSYFIIGVSVIPLLISWSILPLARLHRAHAWKRVANYRLVSSVLAVGIAAPLLMTAVPLAASVTFLVANEAIFAIFCLRSARALNSEKEETCTTDNVIANNLASIRTEYRSSAIYQVFGWSESQIDKILIGSIAGTATLGQYSTSVSISRSGADAVAGGTSRVLRARLATDRNSESATRSIAERTVFPGMLLVFAGCLVVWALNAFLLTRILGPEWDPALKAIPIVAAATLPAFLTWNISTMLAAEGRLRKLLHVRLAGILAALPIALAALTSFEIAAWLLFARDSLIAFAAILLNRSNLSNRLLGISVIFFSILTLGAMLQVM